MMQTHEPPVDRSRFSLARFLFSLALIPLLAGFGVLYSQEAGEPEPLVVLDAHEREVSSLAFTPDQRLLITGGYDATLKLWELPAEEPVRTLTGHQGLILGVSVDPQGNVLAASDSANSIKLWDIPAAGPESSWTGHEATVNAIAVRPNGEIAVSAGDDKIVRVWDRKTGQLLQSLPGHDSEIVEAAFRPDGNQWATGDRAGVLQLWTPGKYLDEDPTLNRTYYTHPDEITGISFQSNNQFALTSGADGTVKLWQLTLPPHRVLAPANEPPIATTSEEGAHVPGKIVSLAANGQTYLAGGPEGKVFVYSPTNDTVRELVDQPGPVRTLAISPNSATAISGSETGALKFWNIPDGADRLQLLGHNGPVRGVAFQSDNAHVASAGEDGTVRLWKLPTPHLPLNGHTDAVTKIAMSPDGQFVATGSRDKLIKTWNATSGAAGITATGHLAPISSLRFRADSLQLASGDTSGELRFWERANAATQGIIGAHTSSVTGIAYAPNAQHLVTTAADGTAKMWRLPLTLPRSIAGHSGAVNAGTLSKDGKLLATASSDKTARLFDMAAGTQVRQLLTDSNELTAVGFSADDATIATGNTIGEILFRKTADAADLGKVSGHTGRIHALNFHPTLPQVMSAGIDGTVRVWSVPESAAPLTGHTMPVLAATVSPDGKLIATSSNDKTVRLWNPENAAVAATLSGHEHPVHSITFRADNQELVSADAAGIIQFWNATTKAGGLSVAAGDEPVRTLAWHSQGTKLLSGSEDGTLRVWQLPLVEPAPIPGHTAAVEVAAVTSDGAIIVTGDAAGQLRVSSQQPNTPPVVLLDKSASLSALSFNDDDSLLGSGDAAGTIHTWTVTDRKTAGEFQGHAGKVTSLVFQPIAKGKAAADSLIATTGADGTLRLWKLAEPAQPLETFIQQVSGMVASRNGKLLATSGPVNGRAAVVIRQLETNTKLTTLLGHTAPIRAMQFSADGTKLITGSDDTTARVWDLTDPKYPELGRFTGHTTPVTAVTISADGKQAISGASDKTLKIWDIAEGSETFNLAGHTGGIVALTMLDANTLISAGDTTLRFWTLSNGQQARSTTVPAAISSFALSPDATQLVVGATNNSLAAYNPANGQVLFELPGHTTPVQSIAFRADGSQLVSRSADGEFRVWNKDGLLRESSNKPEATPNPETKFPVAVAFAVTENTLLLTNATGGLDQQPLKLQRLIAPAKTALLDAAFLPDGSSIVTAGADNMVRQWKLNDGSEIRQFTGATAPVTSVTVTPDAIQVIAGSLDKTVRRWKLADGVAVSTLTQTSPVQSLEINPDGTRLAVSGDEGLLRIWDLTTEKTLQRFIGHDGTVGAVAFGKDATSLVTAGSDQSVRVWPIAAQQVIVAGDGPVKHADWIGETNRFASIAGTGTTVKLWETDSDTATELAAGTMPLETFAVHPDGSRIIAGGAEKKLYQWTVSDGKQIAAWEQPAAIQRIAFTPSKIARGTVVANPEPTPQWDLLVTDAEKRLLTLDAATGDRLEEIQTELASPVLAPVTGSRKVVLLSSGNNAAVYQRALLSVLAAHEGGVNDVVVTVDGKRILSAGVDGKIRIWNAETNQLITTLTAAATPADATDLPAHQRGVTSLTINAEGTRLASGTAENIAQVWDLTAATDAAKPLTTFAHETPLRSVRLSDDGTRLATLAAGNIARVFDLNQGLELERFRSTLPVEQPLLDLAFATDNETLVATGTNPAISVWKLAALRVWPAHANPAGETPNPETALTTAVTFTDDGTRIATCGADGTVRLWPLEATDDKPVLELKAESGGFTSLLTSADGKTLTAAGADQKLYTWNLADGAVVSTTETPAPVTQLSLAGEPGKLAVSGADRHVRIYSVADGRLLVEITVPLPEVPAAAETDNAPQPPAFTAAITPDGNRVISNLANTGQLSALSLEHLLKGHTGAVTGVAYTPDGTKLVTCGVDQLLRLWQVSDGTLLRTWTAHEKEITSVAVTADGKTIVSGSLDQTVKLWPVTLPEGTTEPPAGELISLEPVAVYTHPAAVRSVWPSVNGLRVGTACDDGFARVWDVATGKELERFAGHDQPVTGIAFMTDNLRVISGGADGSVREWRISATKILTGDETAVSGVQWLANGNQFATIGDEGCVKLWDQNFNPVRSYGLPRPEPAETTETTSTVSTPSETGPLPVGKLTALAVRQDSQQLAAGVTVGEGETATGKVHVWNINNAELLQTIETPAPLTTLQYSRDNLKLLGSFADNTVRVYDATTLELHQEIPGGSSVQTARFTPDNRQILLGGADQTVHTWRYVSPTAVRSLAGHSSSVYSVKFSPKGDVLASCSNDGTIRIWNPATGQQLRSLTGHTGAVTAIDFSPDGALLISSGADATVRLWMSPGDDN